MSVCFGYKHENAQMADALGSSIQPRTAIYTDGGHSPISAWVHIEDILQTRRFTVNHSKNLVDPITGNHINWVENRNKHIKKWLKGNRGGGSRSTRSLEFNLAEYLHNQWFTSNDPEQRFMFFIFNIWIHNGFDLVVDTISERAATIGGDANSTCTNILVNQTHGLESSPYLHKSDPGYMDTNDEEENPNDEGVITTACIHPCVIL